MYRRTVSLIATMAMTAGICDYQCSASDHGGEQTVISNVEARRDTDGHILDAHDGCLEYFQDRFYLYGTRYGTTNGFGNTNRYVCYSSPDLARWTYCGELLKDAAPAVYYRPYVKYNPMTHKYVLWCNVNNQYDVAQSDTPTGPFVVTTRHVKMKYGETRGDFGLFLEDDGSFWIVYTYCGPGWARHANEKDEPIQHHQISVEKLAPDGVSATGQACDPIAGNCEAPAMFRRAGLYYLLFDNTSCFGVDGSGARVYTAKAPLGPWTYRGNINVKSSQAREAAIVWRQPGTGRPDAIIRGQQTHVAVLPSADGPVYLWMADRWGSRPDGVKGHDFQYWSPPLQFEADGMIRQLRFEDQWTFHRPADSGTVRPPNR